MMLSEIEAPPSGENISIRKPDPEILIVFRIHFSQMSHRFRVFA
jgi:hypothetical protein